MATITEIQEAVSSIASSVASIDSTLDEVKLRLDTLEAGNVVSQEQLDGLFASLDAAKSQISSVQEEASSLTSASNDPEPESGE